MAGPSRQISRRTEFELFIKNSQKGQVSDENTNENINEHVVSTKEEMSGLVEIFTPSLKTTNSKQCWVKFRSQIWHHVTCMAPAKLDYKGYIAKSPKKHEIEISSIKRHS